MVVDDKNSIDGGRSSSIMVNMCFRVEPVLAFATVESIIVIINVSLYSSILSLLMFKGKVMRDFPAGTEIILSMVV